MPEFLEERLPIAVRAGASYSDDYAVEITQTGGSNNTPATEYRRLVHPFPVRVYRVHYTQWTADLWDQIISLYHRVYGMYAGFRVKALDDYTTNNRTAAPTITDQTIALISAGVYQLQVAYGGSGTPISIGKPKRTIFKPVVGSVIVGVNGVSVPITAMWTVDTTTGRVTFAANKTKTITGITKAISAVISFGAAHSYVAGESVHFSGVAGMTQINGLRGLILSTGATDITVSINSSGFSTYTSGGTVNSRPQTGEAVTAGCEYDIPCRFNSRIDITALSPNARETSEIEIIELLNPLYLFTNNMSIELLNIDCMDYMRDLPDKCFDLAIVDPPYGINFSKAHSGGGGGLKEKAKNGINIRLVRTILNF